MINAKRLFKIANENSQKSEEKIKECNDKAVNYFLDSCMHYAKRGLFNKKTSCLLKRSRKKYFCQTENDGGGFDILDIDMFIKSFNDLGFDVFFFSSDCGYSKFDLSWKIKDN